MVAVAAVTGAWARGLGPFGDSSEHVTVKVMTFNIFYGGDDYDLATGKFCATSNGCPATFTKVVDAIRSTNADIVGIEEGEGNTRAVARRLGWYASPRTQIVSRYPLFDPPGAKGTYVLAEVTPGRFVAVSSIHLPSDPYGPYAVRDGASKAKLLALERAVRVPALRERLDALAGAVAVGMPTFLVGDFNSPSHLDWTTAVAAERDDVPYVVAWPASALAARAGFRDSYREAHPDPVAKPGFTWTPGGPEAVKNEVHDRIDWVLAAGPAKTVTSQILGEKAFVDTDIPVDPFPSDHRGVVSTFEVEPAESPAIISVDERRVFVGDDLEVNVSLGGRSTGEVVIGRTGATTAVPSSTRVDVDGRSAHGVRIPSDGLRPGAYDAMLVTAQGDVVARAPFVLYARGAAATVAVPLTVAAGKPIPVRFSAAPGNRWDWIGLYKATAANVPVDGGIPDDSGDYLLYVYTATEIEGTVAFTKLARPGAARWPLPPGRYEVRLMVDDGYRTIARSSPFTVMG